MNNGCSSWTIGAKNLLQKVKFEFKVVSSSIEEVDTHALCIQKFYSNVRKFKYGLIEKFYDELDQRYSYIFFSNLELEVILLTKLMWMSDPSTYFVMN